MNIQGAVIKEQGVTFAIVIVKPHVLHSDATREQAACTFFPLFGGIPLVLMAQDSRGVPEYWGRGDIIRFLAKLHISQIPWRQYTVS